MPDETIDVPVPLPPSDVTDGNGGNDSDSGENDMATTVNPTIEMVLDQSYTRGHADWIATQQRSNAADAFLSEVTRLTFGAAASMQVQLAGGILAQRSAQSQPQQHSGVAGSKAVGAE